MSARSVALAPAETAPAEGSHEDNLLLRLGSAPTGPLLYSEQSVKDAVEELEGLLHADEKLFKRQVLWNKELVG